MLCMHGRLKKIKICMIQTDKLKRWLPRSCWNVIPSIPHYMTCPQQKVIKAIASARLEYHMFILDLYIEAFVALCGPERK